MKLNKLSIALLGGLALTAPASSSEQAIDDFEPWFSPDVGPLCVAALMSYGVEIGKKCMSGKLSENQERLEETQKLLDEFIVSDPNWNEEILVDFKRQQGGVGLDTDTLCQGDALLIGKGYVVADQEQLRANVEDLIVRFDKPVWGTCL